MKNADQWRPTKYVRHRGRLVASGDPKIVSLTSRLITDVVARWYDAQLKVHCQGKLVDLGCGSVPLYEAYKEFVTEVTCVDWPSSMHGMTHIDQSCDLSKPLPFSDAQFDTIILSDVLEHLPEPQTLLCEMHRILAEGGRSLVNVPFLYWLHEEPHDYYRYTEFALRRFAEEAGFEILMLEPIGGAPEVLADLLAKNIVYLPLVGKCLARWIQTAGRLFISTRYGRRISQRTGKKFPLGYFMVLEKRTEERLSSVPG